MEAVVHVSTDPEDAQAWDVAQELALTPEQRLSGARELQERVFGTAVPDVRESHQVVILIPR